MAHEGRTRKPEFARAKDKAGSGGAPRENPGSGEAANRMKQARTVLVVETEEVVREAIGEMLGEMNFMVRTAGSGEAALQILEEGECWIDLVLSDILLPDMSGMELYRTLRERCEGLAIILMTSYFPAPKTLLSLNLQEVVWLEKPFTAEDFKRALGRVVEKD